ncbi:MAG: glutamate--cysteine ligase, partial [Pseudomonadota bacterium]
MSDYTDITAQINQKILKNKNVIEQWFQETFKNTPPFFYTSIDIRNAGYKLSPVDTNIFPAGFNNITEKNKEQAVIYVKELFAKYYPSVENIIIIPENHTRNKFYLENLSVIYEIIEKAGFQVVIGNLDEEAKENVILQSHSGKDLTLEPLRVNASNYLETHSDFVADLILANNDFTDGAPDLIKDIKQTIIPPIGMGWYQRRKTAHFSAYNEIAKQLCHLIDLDPWFISTIFNKCGVINFKERTGIECITRAVDKVIYKIQQKYDQYNIKHEPYVFIKSNRGTYGMGIMTAKSADDVQVMSKKIRNKMNKIKGGTLNSEVIIQEGVPTIDQVNGHSAENMMYLIGGKPVSCIYRINTEKDSYGNLNATGMHFLPISSDNPTEEQALCPTLSIISRLASYAAAWECPPRTHGPQRSLRPTLSPA